jgi:transcriptional regulator GlxA family with amidase domain
MRTTERIVAHHCSSTGNPRDLTSTADTQVFGLFLAPGFSWMTFAAFIEPMRQVNRLTGQLAYDWRLFSIDGAPVEASSGSQIIVDAGLQSDVELDFIFVCTGVGVQVPDDQGLKQWLRAMVRRGVTIGSLSTGTFLLARAGLLEGYRSTIHWESSQSLKEEFPYLEVTTNLFEIDRDRITCSGATASIDLMLHLISTRFGHDIAAAVSDQFNHGQIRHSFNQQRMTTDARLRSNNPRLIAAIRLMEANIETPFQLGRLADEVGLSKRQLERLFVQRLGTSVIRYYRLLRLYRANILLIQTQLSVVEIGLACGFRSASQFSRDYRELFGYTPAKERRVSLAESIQSSSESSNG